jgi:CPA2 family monovalent cation:H+ antiporter-2
VHAPPILRDLVILVAIAIPVVALAYRLRIPTIVGFLLTGIALGPHGLALVRDTGSVSALAEVGAVLLLFGVGLELSFSRVVTMGREVLLGGAGQMLTTMALAAAVLVLTGLTVTQAVFIGALVAVSSTAIILKLYQARSELDSPHGRVVVAIAVFQDLAVVPLMLLVPVLAGGDSNSGAGALRQVGVSLAVVTAIIVVGRLAVPTALERIVRLRNRELFTLAVLFLGLGAAFVASRFGLSLALGAFLAGLVMAESDYGIQALSDVLPFRDAFSGIFFTSIGMLLDPTVVAEHPLVLFAAVPGIVVLKAAVGAAAIRVLGRPFGTSVIGGIGLAQVGEFSFVLAGAGLTAGLLGELEYQLFLAATVVSMMIAPFAIAGARPVAAWLGGRLGREAIGLRTTEEVAVGALTDHVIVVGYGLNGRNVARALRAVQVPYVVLEENGRVVREAREAGEPILFGDGANPEVLRQVGIERARVVVFAIATPAEERRGVANARQLNPHVHIVVRTRYVASMKALEEAGANEIVPEEFETSLEIFATVLRRYGIAGNRIRRLIEAAREHHYGMLTAAASERRAHAALTPRELGFEVETVTAEPGAPAIGGNPVSLRLRSETGAILLAVIRKDSVIYEFEQGHAFEPGDTAVLIGVEDAIQRARQLFAADRGAAP